MTTHTATSQLPSLSTSDMRDLLAKCDDSASHHVLFVTADGRVHITDEPRAARSADVRFRYETYIRGNDYVGTKAAADDAYVAQRTTELINDWTEGKTGLVDF